MDRLVAFGCSNTYGHGLEDCFIPPLSAGFSHSNMAWPSKLAKYFNRACVNLALPGISNMHILDRILDCDFQKNDLVVILWTYLDRDIIRNINDQDIIHINSEMLDTDIGKKWLMTHTDYNQAMKGMQAIHHAYHYFESIGIEHYHIIKPFWNQVIQAHQNNRGDMIRPLPKYFSRLEFLESSITDYKQKNLPSALDGQHPGQEAHNVFAEDLYKEITQKRTHNVN